MPMPAVSLADRIQSTHRSIDRVLALLRRIRTDVLPRSKRRLDASGERLNESNTRKLESRYRLSDGDSGSTLC